MIKIYRVFGQYGELQVEQLSQERNDGVKIITIKEGRKKSEIILTKEDWQALCEVTHVYGDFFA
jgi:hypothetical protein